MKTLEEIAELLVRSSNVKVVVTFKNCKNLEDSKAFKLVTQTTMSTTARPPQNFQAYFFQVLHVNYRFEHLKKFFRYFIFFSKYSMQYYTVFHL